MRRFVAWLVVCGVVLTGAVFAAAPVAAELRAGCAHELCSLPDNALPAELQAESFADMEDTAPAVLASGAPVAPHASPVLVRLSSLAPRQDHFFAERPQ